MGNASEAAHIRNISTWHSGGGVELDIVELDGGTTFVVANDTISVYASAEAFWAETEDGDESHRTTTLLRATGSPFTLGS